MLVTKRSAQREVKQAEESVPALIQERARGGGGADMPRGRRSRPTKAGFEGFKRQLENFFCSTLSKNQCQISALLTYAL